MDIAAEVAQIVHDKLLGRARRFVHRPRWRTATDSCRIIVKRWDDGAIGGFWIRSRDERRWKIDVCVRGGSPLWLRRFSWGKERDAIRIPLEDPRMFDKARSTVIKYIRRATRKQRAEASR